MIRVFGCGLVFALLTGSASACLNDRELAGHEREFRSEYSRRAHPTPKVRGGGGAQTTVLIGGGMALVGGAVAATLRLSGKPRA